MKTKIVLPSTLALVTALCLPLSVSAMGQFVKPKLLAGAHPGVCRDVFANEGLAVKAADLARQYEAGYQSSNQKAYGKWKQLQLKWKESGLPENAPFLKATHDLLIDEELSVFHDRVFHALGEVNQQFAGEVSSKEIRAALVKSIAKQNASELSPAVALERAKLIESNDIDKALLMKALGRMSAEETLRATVGENLAKPSPDSLVGQYVTKSKSLGVALEPFYGAFQRGPKKAGHGEKRLFIPVDARTAPLVQELFANDPHFFFQNHGAMQGTLQLYHDGHNVTAYLPSRQAATLAQGDWNTGTAFQVDKLAPMMVVSTTEASRLKNYFELAQLAQTHAKYPWSLKNLEGQEPLPYCRTGAYSSCTHYVGEIPFGDTIVSQLAFPKNNADDPYSRDPGDMLRKRGEIVRLAPVGSYTHYQTANSTREIGYDTRIDRLTRMVYKEVRANAQLWQVAGNLKKELGAGEFANPGWVLHSLAAASDPKRVPVVLVYVNDASVPLTQATLDDLATRVVSPR